MSDKRLYNRIRSLTRSPGDPHRGVVDLVVRLAGDKKQEIEDFCKLWHQGDRPREEGRSYVQDATTFVGLRYSDRSDVMAVARKDGVDEVVQPFERLALDHKLSSASNISPQPSQAVETCVPATRMAPTELRARG